MRGAHATAPSAQREAATGLRRRPGAQRARAIGAERVARGGDGAAAACPAQEGAQRPRRLARSAERETAIRLAARALARSARAIGTERAARGARWRWQRGRRCPSVCTEHCDDLIRHDWEAIAC